MKSATRSHSASGYDALDCPDGARGSGVETERPAVSSRPVAALGQGEAASGVQPVDGSVWFWLARRVAAPSNFAPPSPWLRRPRPYGPALRGRRLGRLFASSSSDGLCGRMPSSRNRFALLRIAQRGRCNCSTSCDTECVGHKVVSSRSSSSVQRDITTSALRPPALMCPIRNFFHIDNLAAPFGK
jgi:hypothetical protein